jgi:phosphoserine phosphatase
LSDYSAKPRYFSHTATEVTVNDIKALFIFFIQSQNYQKQCFFLCRISPGMADLVKKLKANNTDVFLVSGGFRQMIKVGTLFHSTAPLW